jgi:hypothetical protein
MKVMMKKKNKKKKMKKKKNKSNQRDVEDLVENKNLSLNRKKILK